MKITHTLIVFFSAIAFQACSSHPEKAETAAASQQPEDTAVAVKENFPAGRVIGKVVLKNDTAESYAMYLPKSYDTKKAFPVIYIFDAHADGKLPVDKYSELAEKYGYILVGSNNSQNGMQWPEAQQIAARFFADTRDRLAIDGHRVYAMGFSGGARVANAITLTNGGVAGVICCGAANPMFTPVNGRSDYTFFGIAGTADFNYTEMHKYDLVELAGHNVKHAIMTFDGKHEWPDAAVMENAFTWEELDNMRRNPAAKDEAMITPALKEAKEKLNGLMDQHKDYEAYELCRRTISFYDNLGDLTFFFDTYKKLKTSAAVDQQLRAEEAAWTREEKLKGEYMNDLQTQNFEWWQKEISTLSQKIKTGKDKNEVNMQKRILSFLSLACYMQTSGALKQGNISAADYWDKMYKLVDPGNSEADYFMAEIRAMQNDGAAAIAALNASAKNGFTDVHRLQSDSAFVSIRNDEKYKEVLKKMEEKK